MTWTVTGRPLPCRLRSTNRRKNPDREGMRDASGVPHVMKDKTLGTAFWVSITLLVVGIVLTFVFGWLGEAQDGIVSILKRTENY